MTVVPSLAFAGAACRRNAASVANTARRAADRRASSNETPVAASSCLQTAQASHIYAAALQFRPMPVQTNLKL